MLPFLVNTDSNLDVITRLDHRSIIETDHDSVATWRIRGDGSVSIPRAAIVCSSDGSHGSDTISAVYNILAQPNHTSDLTEDLKKAADIDGVIYAVAISESLSLRRGILLYGVLGQEAKKSKQTLVKVGYFQSSGNWGMPESTEVSWRVL